jgi:uncharacterized membrane protein (DUF106 family)
MTFRKLTSFLVGVIIFSVLPLIGWGLNDIAGFLHNPIRLAFILMMAILSVLVVINPANCFALADQRRRSPYA